MTRHRRQKAEVQRDNDRDENPEQHDELALRDQVRFAGLIDQFGDFEHGAMNRRVLQLHIDRQAEQQAADAEEQSDHQKGMSVHAEETHGRQIRQGQVGFASACVFRLRVGECGKQQGQEGHHGFVLALQEGSWLPIRSSRVNNIAHNERQHTHNQKETDPTLNNTHMSLLEHRFSSCTNRPQ